MPKFDLWAYCKMIVSAQQDLAAFFVLVFLILSVVGVVFLYVIRNRTDNLRDEIFMQV